VLSQPPAGACSTVWWVNARVVRATDSGRGRRQCAVRRPTSSGPSPQPPLVDKLRLAFSLSCSLSPPFSPSGSLGRSHRGHSRPTRNKEWNHGAWRAAFRRNSRGRPAVPPRDRTQHARQVHVAGAPPGRSPPPGRFLFPAIAVGFGFAWARHAHTSLTPRLSSGAPDTGDALDGEER
jgi:hypothetical protein